MSDYPREYTHSINSESASETDREYHEQTYDSSDTDTVDKTKTGTRPIYPSTVKWSERETTHRRQFASILIENATPCVLDAYEEIEIMRMVPTPYGHKKMFIECMVPRLAQHPRVLGITDTDTPVFAVYVNIMNISRGSCFSEHVEQVKTSFYSLSTLQQFALYSCDNEHNMICTKKIYPQYATQYTSYWVRIPDAFMSYSQAFTLHKKIVANATNETRPRTNDPCSFWYTDEPALFDIFMKPLASAPLFRTWHVEEYQHVCTRARKDMLKEDGWDDEDEQG